MACEVKPKYNKLKELEDAGVLLDAEDQVFLRDTENIANLEGTSLREPSTVYSITDEKVTAINQEAPRLLKITYDSYGQETRRWTYPVTVTRIEVSGNRVTARVVNDKGYEQEVPLRKVLLDQKNAYDLVMGSEPGTFTDGQYREILEKEKIRSMAEVEAVADMLAKMDGDALDAKHKDKLMEVLRAVASPLIKAIPEMSIYLDEQARMQQGYFIPEGNVGIYLSRNKDEPKYGSQKTMLEIYVHEMVHAATHYAVANRKSQVAATMNRLKSLHDAGIQVLTVEDFMPDVSINENAEREIAKGRLHYVNQSMEEFLVYALTDAKVMKKLEGVKVYNRNKEKPKTFFEQVKALTYKLVEAIVRMWRKEPKAFRASEAVFKVTMDLMRANNKANDKIKTGFIGKMDDFLEIKEEQWRELVDKVQNKITKKALSERPLNGSKWEEAKWFAANIHVILLDKEAAFLLDNIMNTFLKPHGLFQTLIRHVRDTDEFAEIAQDLTLASGQIDRHRELMVAQIGSIMHNAFKKKLKQAHKAVLQSAVLQADGAQLVLKYGKGVVELYKSESKRKKEVERLENELKSKVEQKEWNYYKYQIDNLAKYMITGVGNEVLLKNAEAITMMLGTALEKKEANEEVVALIDTLVSLRAIEMNSNDVNKEFAVLLTDEYDGVEVMARQQHGILDNIRKNSSAKDNFNRRKGYVRETYDDYVTSTVAPVQSRRDMVSKGYKLVKVLPTSGLVAGEVTMGLYVSRNMIRQPMNRSAIRITGDKQGGRTLFENILKGRSATASLMAKKALAAANVKNAKAVLAIMKGQVPELGNAVSPEFDDTGKIVEYRFNVEMEDKVKHLGLDMNGFEAVGRTLAHEIDVRESKKMNEVIWDEIVLDSATNIRGSGLGMKNKKAYTVISLESDDQYVRDIARILPVELKSKLAAMRLVDVDTSPTEALRVLKNIVGADTFKKMSIHQKTALAKQLSKGNFWVRSDMLLDIFGTRDWSITQAPKINLLPVHVKTMIRQAENWWKEIIKLYKVNIIIKVPAVIIGNIVSNAMYLVQLGFNPSEVLKMQSEGYLALENYLKNERELARLSAVMLQNDSEVHKMDYARLVSQQSNSPVKKMIDAGLYSNIIEDLSVGDFKSNSRVSNWISKKSENSPEIVQDGVHALYVTEKTTYFQMIQQLTAKSDFVARYSQLVLAQKRAEKKFKRENGRDMTKSELAAMERSILREVRNSFINYNKPDSAGMQYINDMGFAMFTKYAWRIQKVIKDGVAKHPLRFGLALLGQEMVEGTLGVNPDDIVEKSIFLHGPFDLFYTPGTFDILKDLAIPATYDTLQKAL